MRNCVLNTVASEDKIKILKIAKRTFFYVVKQFHNFADDCYLYHLENMLTFFLIMKKPIDHLFCKTATFSGHCS